MKEYHNHCSTMYSVNMFTFAYPSINQPSLPGKDLWGADVDKFKPERWECLGWPHVARWCFELCPWHRFWDWNTDILCCQSCSRSWQWLQRNFNLFYCLSLTCLGKACLTSLPSCRSRMDLVLALVGSLRCWSRRWLWCHCHVLVFLDRWACSKQWRISEARSLFGMCHHRPMC